MATDDWRKGHLSAALDEGIRGLAAQEAAVDRLRQQATSLLVIVPGSFIVTAASNVDLYGWWASVAGFAAWVATVAVCFTLWPRTFGFHQDPEALTTALTESEGTSDEEEVYVRYRSRAMAEDYTNNEQALGRMLLGVRVAIGAVVVAATCLLVAIGWGVVQ